MNITQLMACNHKEEPEAKEENFKLKAQYSPFDFIDSINYTKKNLLSDAENPEYEETRYNPWIVNKGLSYFPDTIGFANLINSKYHLDHKLQYDFLINIIKPKKRYARWAKKTEKGDIDIVKEVYGYSDKKAEIALSLLSTEQLAELKKIKNKGGFKNETTSRITNRSHAQRT